MSADNFFTIKRHPLGGYAAVMGFASDDNEPVAQANDAQFSSIEDALTYAHNEYSEYGVSVDAEVAAELNGRPDPMDTVLAIADVLDAPPTDDPLDTLREIAALVGMPVYGYFHDKGQWVLYP